MDYFLISIIVPIYKVEKYLDACVQSIVDQTYANLEIILVDDASPDDCPQICDKWLKKDSRIKVLHKENGGVSSARNSGIDIANGKYIMFVDGDDCLVKDIIEKIYMFSHNNEDNICQFNYSSFMDEQIINSKEIYINSIDKNEMLASLIWSLSNKKYFLGKYRAVWGKLLKTKVIRDNNLRFIEGQYIGEDALFLFEYVLYIKELKVLNEFGYLYRYNMFSATQRYKDDLLQQYQNEINTYLNIIKQRNITFTAEISGAINSYIFNAYLAIIENELNGIKQGISTKKELFSKSSTWLKENKETIKIRVSTSKISGKLAKVIKILYGKIPNESLCTIVCGYFKLKEQKL